MTAKLRSLAFVSVALLAAPAVAQTDGRAQVEGTWVLAQPADQAERVVDRAASRAADAMSFFVRAIARSRLREGTTVNRRIVLSFDGDQVTVRFSDGSAFTTPLGQTVRRRDPEGEMMNVTARFRDDGALEHVFQTDGGTRWYVFHPEGDGRLRVEVVTDSPRMPEAMRFTLSYRRR
ncbi:MAG: hypothetical protein VYE22_24770 [Myxococcota bacterium]|nr:hypothetical protein [Myxococcota bacterium]